VVVIFSVPFGSHELNSRGRCGNRPAEFRSAYSFLIEKRKDFRDLIALNAGFLIGIVKSSGSSRSPAFDTLNNVIRSIGSGMIKQVGKQISRVSV
jgi:hypothetical protein